MKPISKLKDEARRHEQREEWDKAVALYLEALRVGDEGEGEVELPLYNRVGDLYVRMGRPGAAVQYYEQAADRYADAGLYNNAIALCNKALRYQPDHLDLLRKLGQFSATQGFIVEARRYFLDYAERQFVAGQVGEALSALEDFARVAEEGEVRELLGQRLQAHGRSADAARELSRAHTLYTQEGQHDRAAAVLGMVRAISPEAADELEATPPEPGSSRPRRGGVETGEALAEPVPGLADEHLDESASSADAPDDAGLQLEPAGGFDRDPGEPSAPTELPDGYESTSLSPAEAGDGEPPDGFEVFEASDTPQAADEPIETVGLTGYGASDGQPGDAPDVAPMEGFEPGSMDFSAAAAELGPVETDLEIERDEASFDDAFLSGPSLDDAPPAGDDAEPHEAAAFDDIGVFDDDAFTLPDLDVAGETPGDASPVDASVDDVGTGFVLPEFGHDEEAASGDVPEGFPLPPMDDEDDVGDATLPLLGIPDAEPGVGLPLLDDEAEALLDAGAEGVADPAHGEEPGPAPAADPVPAPAPDEPIHYGEGEGAADAADAADGEAAPEAEPVASEEEEFVDLGQLLAEDRSDSTRFQIRETAPTGDEDQDFAELLSQFKSKLSEHLPPEDAAAHYDLGLAFKEMGLIDEAIAEFQVSLRAGQTRLKVFEELGDCFLQKEQYNIAEKVLRRGLEMEYDDDVELLGVYYHLGRAYEAMGRSADARDAYERVLGLDINFRDVSNRLARL